jgi:hypothetical protein
MNNILIELYVRLVNEYYSIMGQSDILKNIENKRYIIYIGLNAINNIFKINLTTTNNIQTTYFYCEKACYCYLEYIEQINKTEVLNNLNISDVVKFVYKETIIYNENAITNVNNCSSINIENSNTVFTILTRISSILFNWNNDSIDESIQTIICQKYLPKYLYLFVENNIVDYIDYLDTIIEKIKMNKDVYIEFLEQFFKKIKNVKNNNDIKNKIMIFLNNFENNNNINNVNDVKLFVKTYL